MKNPILTLIALFTFSLLLAQKPTPSNVTPVQKYPCECEGFHKQIQVLFWPG